MDQHNASNVPRPRQSCTPDNFHATISAYESFALHVKRANSLTRQYDETLTSYAAPNVLYYTCGLYQAELRKGLIGEMASATERDLARRAYGLCVGEPGSRPLISIPESLWSSEPLQERKTAVKIANWLARQFADSQGTSVVVETILRETERTKVSFYPELYGVRDPSPCAAASFDAVASVNAHTGDESLNNLDDREVERIRDRVMPTNDLEDCQGTNEMEDLAFAAGMEEPHLDLDLELEDQHAAMRETEREEDAEDEDMNPSDLICSSCADAGVNCIVSHARKASSGSTSPVQRNDNELDTVHDSLPTKSRCDRCRTHKIKCNLPLLVAASHLGAIGDPFWSDIVHRVGAVALSRSQHDQTEPGFGEGGAKLRQLIRFGMAHPSLRGARERTEPRVEPFRQEENRD